MLTNIKAKILRQKKTRIKNQLTEKIIDQACDEYLLEIIFAHFYDLQSITWDNEYETVMSWNKSRQAIYMIFGVLQGEVCNGGYNQFYSNVSGRFYKDLPDALALVGADLFADLMKRANDVFEKEYDYIMKHQDGSIEGFAKSYENNPLNPLTDEFFALNNIQNLTNIQIQYIRQHKKEFIDL